MDKLTDLQKVWYLSQMGCRCPYCHPDQITATDHNFDGNECVQEVLCESCGKFWHDIYKLVDVVEVL